MRRALRRSSVATTVAALAAVALSFTTARAPAQPAQSAEARADALYREAAAHIEDGKPEEAIPLLENSLRLKPTGLGARYGLADCYERTGKLASALALFWSVAEEAKATGKGPLEGDARARVAKLFPRIILDVPAAVRAVPQLVVAIDGHPIAPPDFGQPLPVPPGEHVITASAPGKQSMVPHAVTASAGATLAVVIPPLEAALEPRPIGLVPPPAEGHPSPASAWGTQRTIGLVLGGAGLVGVVVGTVFGVQTLSTSSEVKRNHHCTEGDPTVCNPQGYALYQEANKTATRSNVALALGGAAMIAGVVTFVTAGTGKPGKPGALRVSAGPMVGAGTAGLSLQGEW